jgi:hypothetical protein
MQHHSQNKLSIKELKTRCTYAFEIDGLSVYINIHKLFGIAIHIDPGDLETDHTSY